MGGINPPTVSSTALRTTQAFTHELCVLNASFWDAHAAIERAVLSNNDKPQATQDELQTAKQSFETAAMAAKSASSLACTYQTFSVEECKELIEYLDSQTAILSDLSKNLGSIAQVIDLAARQGLSASDLQDGMLYDGPYATVRYQSLIVINALTNVNNEHAKMVSSSNLVTSIAA